MKLNKRGFTPHLLRGGKQVINTRAIRKGAGFTLIELLVVIGIIATLTTVGTVSLNKARSKARDTKRLAEISAVRSAMEQYFNDYNTFKTTNNTCAAADALVSSCTGGTDVGLKDYLPNIGELKDPALPNATDVTKKCADASPTACLYTFRGTAGIDCYQIRFFLENENKNIGLQQKMNLVTQDGYKKLDVNAPAVCS